MISPDISNIAQTLEQFYEMQCKIKELTEYPESISGHHAKLQKLANEKGVKVIKEVGCGVGVTLACLAFATPERLIAVDRLSKVFAPYQRLFEKHALENGYEFEFKRADSLDSAEVEQCDLLHLDTIKNPHQITRELSIHSGKVAKYIVVPGTANCGRESGVLAGIAKFITYMDQNWQIVEHSPHRRGYIVLKRVKRLPSSVEKNI